jgi:CHAT domain-containing protein
MPQMLLDMKDASGGVRIKTVEELEAWDQYNYRQQFNDPLSNSFLILAGVNQGGDGLDDGYLTAREVMDLNLEGTELTILAACETGLGQSSPSEGILGLRKAFSLAGSRQLLISLWEVDAKWTGELIKIILENCDKLGDARILQSAKIALMKKLRVEGLEPFPFYWAGFILVGKGN